ncbi:MAG: glycosyltransferase family 2 protein [Pseudomonadota bacterium]
MAPSVLSARKIARVSGTNAQKIAHVANVPGRPWELVDELVAREIISAEAGAMAIRAAQRAALPVQDILISRRLTSDQEVARALATVHGVQLADLELYPPDGRLVDAFGPDAAIKSRVVPWKRLGAATLVVAPSQHEFRSALPQLRRHFSNPQLAIAPLAGIGSAITRLRHQVLARQAEHRVESIHSCRSLRLRGWPAIGVIAIACLILVFCMAPVSSFSTFLGWALLTLFASTGLKATAAIATLLDKNETVDAPTYQGLAIRQMPRISILVPLYKETKIAEHLVTRLQRLEYPRERLDVILVTEGDDLTTKETLGDIELPQWIRQIAVPPGQLKTKPKALNYALDHCRGTIVGVYDAEDAPEADQLLKVAAHFAQAAPEVACLQGRLDYYNPRTNWLSRCFTMEYAAWFRVILPGLARLRLPVPLGGTTLFFRRAALDELGGWDAHNVTEDADLGLRLARRGYRTELCDTVTYEEANCRAWPWIKQRSRWLKGYAATYAVHMRNPRALLRDLGPWGFLGVQLLFAGTLSQFLLAPILWSFWLMLFGLAHPMDGTLGSGALIFMATLFFTSEVLAILVVWLGLARSKHKGLYAWAPTLHLYFPLGALASYKGFYELFGSPFYWDKTDHGIDLSAEGPTSEAAFQSCRENVDRALLPATPPPRFEDGSHRLHLNAV